MKNTNLVLIWQHKIHILYNLPVNEGLADRGVFRELTHIVNEHRKYNNLAKWFEVTLSEDDWYQKYATNSNGK